MKKILIVEDEKDILDFLKESLAKRGFNITVSSDGKDALEKIKEVGPDLVISDILLPQASGLEVLSWIKEHRPATLVILASAKKEIEDIKKGYALKADYYITKPYSIEDILKGINVLFSLKGD